MQIKYYIPKYFYFVFEGQTSNATFHYIHDSILTNKSGIVIALILSYRQNYIFSNTHRVPEAHESKISTDRDAVGMTKDPHSL